MSDNGMVVGVIHPAKSETERPEFEIIRRDGWRDPGAEVRPCEHAKFILDERWSTVTCGKCKERVDPFSAIMYYAEKYQEIRRRHDWMVEAEKSLHTAELKRLSRLRDATEEERYEIARLTGWSFKGGVEDLREAADRIRRTIGERKSEKRPAPERDRYER
ncbi:MAG: hypothetical protein H0U67_09390 [Gemmatimonadetes bacterium]|nr:hypothetical protein [Gemmatimonadota bacterium]